MCSREVALREEGTSKRQRDEENHQYPHGEQQKEFEVAAVYRLDRNTSHEHQRAEGYPFGLLAANQMHPDGNSHRQSALQEPWRQKLHRPVLRLTLAARPRREI